MTSFTRHLILVLTLTPLISAPAAAGGLSHFGLHLGPGGFGMSFSTSDWAVYGAAWNDPAWQPSYETTLEGYGEWCVVSGLGRVWRPWVNTGWRPFSHGRWIWTDYDWTWVAYEPWGYFPHHYGNWALASFGWVWVPGWTYRPAPVTWVGCGAYVGWYPAPPPGWSHSARAYHRGWHHGYDRGYADGWRDARHATWVPWREMGAANLSHHTTAHQRVVRTSPGTRVNHLGAPSRTDVTRRGATIPQTKLERRTISTGGRDVTVARPAGARKSIEQNGARTSRSVLDRRALEPRTSGRPEQADTARTRTPEFGSTREPSRGAASREAQQQPAPPANRETRAGAERRSPAAAAPSAQPRGNRYRSSPSSSHNGSSRQRTTEISKAHPSGPQPRHVDTGYRKPVESTRTLPTRGSRSEVVRSPRPESSKKSTQPPAVQPSRTTNRRESAAPRSRREAGSAESQPGRSRRKPR